MIDQGVGPNHLVGACINKSLEFMVAILGILKAGGAYLPLDTNYPQERINYMLSNSNALLLLTQRSFIEKLNHYKGSYFCIDDTFSLTAYPETSPACGSESSDLLYVIYTSGSTGQPKGVGVNHCNEANLLTWYSAELELGSNSRCLLVSATGFDLTQKNMFAVLVSGGSLVLPSEDFYDPEILLGLLSEHKISLINCTPSMFYPLVKEGSDFTALSTLRFAILGGEPILIEPMLAWLGSRDCHCEIVNSYGPTECTDIAAIYRLPRSEVFVNQAVPIGKPINNVKAVVVGQYRELVPVGVVGELLIGGAGVTEGYLGQSELTQEKFIHHPFSENPNERVYRTGDLVRWLPDGNLEFVGRVDNQVKVRGFRIELGEIETALIDSELVREAVVLAHSHEADTGNYYLAAYVVSDESVKISQEVLRHTLQAQLPEYMIPSVFINLDELPLTPNGKVDRKALPVPSADDLFTQEYIAPRTEVEASLVELWSDILKLPKEKVGVQDNFFELGGHSLLATRVVGQIRSTFMIEIPIRDIFTANTIQSLATLVEKNLVDSSLSNQEVYPLKAVSRNSELPLSFAQQRLWFLDQFEEDADTQYNIPIALRLSGTLDVVVLERALNTLIQRHESLRTSFQSENDNTTQTIADNIPVTLGITDINEEDITAQFSASADHVFDLSKGPLFKIDLRRLPSTDFILLINMHHIISDGWSIGVFNQELSVLYQAYSQGKQSPLLALPIQYPDFSHWQRQWLQGEVLEKQVSYWKKQLTGAPALLELPTDRSRPASQSYRGHTRAFNLSAELSEQLHTLRRQTGTTLFMTLLAGFTTLLSRYSGQEDICVGTPIAGRQRPELEKLIGFFVNTLILRTQIEDDISVSDLLEKVKDTALSAYAHQDIPFEHLVEVLKPERSLSYSPLFQVMFVLQNIDQGSFNLPGVDVEEIEREATTAKFDLTLGLAESSEGLQGWVEYNIDLFDRSTIERMVAHYQRILEAMVSHTEQTVCEIDLLSEQEKQQLLNDWNDTEVDYPKEACVHQLFEQQVEKAPDAIALVFNDQQLTYRQLNNQSNQLAHYLIDQGVGPELRVGLCVERSLDMIVGMLGILKAGGAYVPIDPSYPQQRKEFLISDSGITLLLLQSSLKETIPVQSNIQYFYLNRQRELLLAYSQALPDINSSSLNLAYVIYTSGSTGVPKGVCVSHFSVSHLCFWHQNAFEVTANSKATQLAGMGFDAMAWEVWPYLTCAASINIVPQDLLLMPKALVGWIQQHCVTHCFTPTPLAENIILEQWMSSISMCYLLMGGDRFKSTVPEKLPFKLVNNYGPTEGTVVASSGMLNVGDVSTLTIGRVIDNVKGYVVDLNMQQVPVGVVGELLIGGKGLARGYLDRGGLSAEKFIPNKFSQTAGERIYKTGDLVRFLAGGSIEFVGRIDDQVKMRGFRIELGEIENVLTEQSFIREAVVLAHSRKGEQLSQYLVAYVVGEVHRNVNKQRLRQALQVQLPDYMVPSVFIILDELPLTPNGKVDRKALPSPKGEDLDKQDYVAPRTKFEKILATIWSDILQLPRDSISIYDSFFDLGGHSLLGVQLNTQLRRVCNLELPLRLLFEYPTIVSLGVYLEIGREDEKNNQFVDLKKEVTLDPEIRAANTQYPCVKVPRCILLTGATGFIGQFLLCELLNKTSAQFVCLVRANSDGHAYERLKTRLVNSRLWKKNFASRMTVLSADIAKPLLGLSTVDFKNLAEEVDVIYHNATAMNHIASYSVLKATTVGGTQEILRLACTFKLKPVHYSSTVDTFSQSHNRDERERVVDEFSSIREEQHLEIEGYSASKCVAENIVKLAIERGVPCCIYRFGLVAGDSLLGRYDVDQWLYRLLSTCLELGCYPVGFGTKFGIAPVDAVVNALVLLAQRYQERLHSDALNNDIEAPQQTVFHLDSPNQLEVCQFFEVYNKAVNNNVALQEVSFKEWMHVLKNTVGREGKEGFSIYPLMLHYASVSESNKEAPSKATTILSEATRKLLKEEPFVFPEVNSVLLETYWLYIVGESCLEKA